MIVSFTTAKGSIYHLDHTNGQFVQESPQQRVGAMRNKPTVRVGHPVEIQTDDPNGKAALKVIVTSPVATREVSFA